MRAAVLPAIGEKVEYYEDIDATGPGPGEVRIRMRASGVCHSDLSGQNGTLPIPLPAVLGHEGAGEVIAVGEGVTECAVGDHVIVAWVPPCGVCSTCLGGQPQLCMDEFIPNAVSQRFARGEDKLFGFAGTGTFAEELVVPQKCAVKIPNDVPYDVASLIGCGVTTGVGAAINTAKVKPGSNVAVIGCGGVGISVIQGARIAGAAEIVAIDLSPERREAAKKFGATHATDPDGAEALKNDITAGKGFDYAFEVVGLPVTIRNAYDLTRRGGMTVVVGAGALDAMVQFSAYELFFMEKTIQGSYYGSADVRKDFARLLRLWRAGRLDLEGMITNRIDLTGVNDAFEMMKRGEGIRSVIELS
jgi:S-(hydroxymethyl)glutathione dehydrogenase/alcohol dehydrogenase